MTTYTIAFPDAEFSFGQDPHKANNLLVRSSERDHLQLLLDLIELAGPAENEYLEEIEITDDPEPQMSITKETFLLALQFEVLNYLGTEETK